MITELEKLSEAEYDLLLKAPVLMSVLASCTDGEVNKKQKADAIKLSHIKTFTSVPELRPYYKEVEKNFQQDFESAAETYHPFDDKKRNALKKEIEKVLQHLKKLNPEYAELLGKSLERYAGHVKRATHSVFHDFVFPMVILDMKHHNH
jgi:catalase